jgi:SAM-dependent methyltransferase
LWILANQQQQNLPFGITYDFNSAAKLYMDIASKNGSNNKWGLAKAFELAMDGKFNAAASAFESLYGAGKPLKQAGLLHAGLCHLICGEICAAAIAFRQAKKMNENDYWIRLLSGVSLRLLGLPGSANTDWFAASQINPNQTIQTIVGTHLCNQDHPERHALFPICRGVGLDVGCGSNKTHPDAIGVDLTPKGQRGVDGGQKNEVSQSDIVASGDNLYMFTDQSFDYIVQRHNLEHYQDPVKALQEWYRLLKPGGILGMVIPDDRHCDTIKLDPTHKHVFTPSSLQRILSLIGGFEIAHMGSLLYHWSFICVARKMGADSTQCFDYFAASAGFEKNQIMDKAHSYDKNGLNALGDQCRRYAKTIYGADSAGFDHRARHGKIKKKTSPDCSFNG